jgi:hypothetical protein
MANLPPVPFQSKVLGKDGLVTRDWARYFIALTDAITALQVAGTFVDNVAALAGGLTVGQTYQTATGEVRVVV